MKYSIYSLFSVSILLSGTSCIATNSVKMTQNENPLFQKSTLQYQAPRFDLIKNEHFRPAIDKGIEIHNKEIAFIAENPEIPTFDNSIWALEKSGELLKRAYDLFSNLTSSNTNPSLQKLDEIYAPILSNHTDSMYLNETLFKRIKQLYDHQQQLNLDKESLSLLNFYYTNFVIKGANLSTENKAALKKLNSEEATLSTKFSNKLLDARKNAALLLTNKAELEGLSEEAIAQAAQAAKNIGKSGYLLHIGNTTQQSQLQQLRNRATREKLYKNAWERAEKGDENDTRQIIENLAKIRIQKAKLLGFENYASWKLQDQMAKKPENARQLLADLAKIAVQKAKEEAHQLQEIIDKEKNPFPLKAWDWNFYAEKLRKEKYNFDEAELKPYFEIQTVLEKGVFFAANQLYGISFKERKDLPVYHPDVKVYEIFDKDGSSMALYYLDFYTRDNKNGGAWMNNFVTQSKKLGQKPVITNVYNYSKPSEGHPSLINFDDVTTIFHEFGHTLHGLFAEQDYPSLSGTSVARDFVEYPSQINEHWALDSKVLQNYALHYQTKKAIPQELVLRMEKASKFNQGYAFTEILAAATLDLQWHSLTNIDQIKPALVFENEELKKMGLYLEQVPPRYHSPYFLHIWANGYSAGYYAYVWSEMLDFDSFAWFKNNAGLTRKNGDHFRKTILSRGNTEDLNKIYTDFTGKNPDVKYLFEGKGLK